MPKTKGRSLPRLLICYLGGIWAAEALFFTGAPLVAGIALAVVAAGLLLLHLLLYALQSHTLGHGRWGVERQERLRQRLVRGGHLLLGLLLFLLAAVLTMRQRPNESPYPNEWVKALWEVTTPLKQHTQSVTCEGRLIGHFPGDSLIRHLPSSRYRLYFSLSDSAAALLTPGTRIVARQRLQPFEPLPGSPTFDYPTYARHQGWSGSTYLAKEQWHRLETGPLQAAADTLARDESLVARCQRWLLTLYRQSGLTKAPLGLLTALTMGDRDLLPGETRQLFSEGGVAHLLALSGLHVGLLYALIIGLLSPLRGSSSGWRLAALLWSLALIWGFALFTGLSASVVRSVTMFSLLAISGTAGGNKLTMSRLAATLLLMLMVRPYWLFDVGFQLSFCGVGAILWLQPPPPITLLPQIGWRQRLRQFVTACLAAQLGTTPLVAFYFGTFSPYFLLANLWCMPLVALLLYLTVGWLLCLAVGWLIKLTVAPLLYLAVGVLALLPCSWRLTEGVTDYGGLMSGLSEGVAALINGTVALLTEGLRLIQRLPWAQISLPRPDSFELLILYAMLLILPAWWRSPIKQRTLFLLIALWLLATYHYFLKPTIS